MIGLLHFYDSILYDPLFNPIAHATVDGTVHVTMGEIHDIAAANVTPLKTIVGQGYTMNISVTVANQGEFAKTFSITLYANTTAIETKEITLQSGASTTLVFTWNTTSYAKGNYTLWAYTWPVPGEALLENNTLTNGWVKVVIAGNIDGSGRADVGDLSQLGAAWFSTPNSPNWNPNADIDNNLRVDVSDLSITGTNWFQTDP